MSDDNEEILSEDEMEALAEGVSSGEVEVESGSAAPEGEVAHYNFHQPAHLLKARLPALDAVNERFGKAFEATLFGFLQRVVEIEVAEVEMVKYLDYVNSLAITASVNRVKVNELNGSILLNLNPNLVYLIVDCFFGGPGKIDADNLEREYSVTEKRIIERVLSQAFKDLSQAWSSITKLSFEYLNAENQTQMLELIDPSEIVIICKFTIKLTDAEGEIHIVMPHSILEPLRPLLASGARKEFSDSEDENWRQSLKNRLQEVPIDIRALFTETTISLGELLSLKAGDFIPINVAETTVVSADEVPLFVGKIGMSNKMASVRML